MVDIKLVEVWYKDERIGRLALTPDALCAFEYDATWLLGGNSISPFSLPLKAEVFVAKRTPFNGGFGVFDDSLPDGWGSFVLDRFIRKNGDDPFKLTVLQRLALVGSSGRGALEYRPDHNNSSDGEVTDLDRLAAEAQKIVSNEIEDDSLDLLYRYSGSSGGARPKVFVKMDGREWLVKFKASSDPADIGQIEYEYSLLAGKCGIMMPETRLFNGKYFGVERFDRSGLENGNAMGNRSALGKIHTISAAGLLGADFRIPSLDYGDLLQVCLVLTKNMEEVAKLFRQMVFNVFIRNRDDHAKNFSFQLINGEWKLSPAYDLLPGSGFNGFHTTTVNNNGEPTIADMLEVARKAGMNSKVAGEIIEEIRATVGKV